MLQSLDLRLEIAANLLLPPADGPGSGGRPRVDRVKGYCLQQHERSCAYSLLESLIEFYSRSIPLDKPSLLLGGNKTGDERWYKTNVRIADKRYREHLNTLRKGGGKSHHLDT